jgi:hypothetical protein
VSVTTLATASRRPAFEESIALMAYQVSNISRP